LETIDEPPGSPGVYILNRLLIFSAEHAETFSFADVSVEVIIMILGLLVSALYSGSEVAFFRW
jgi:putative hemolysin